MIDFRRDDWRKSDHVQVLAAFEGPDATFAADGFSVKHVAFWNTVFQGWIANILMKLFGRLRAGPYFVLVEKNS